ncbi:uncharacterized protein LOC117115729 isoform X1 [Anneissia japonica]|uniref:uncharacterized protein LOC117115729 isoform X1 n=1 Tax=Anneissia japonica TaxID=1529436 RepID=UPI0014255F8D|nr:uncharacterized protein LOC117115729 isoform X1 [Anneissia japonica]
MPKLQCCCFCRRSRNCEEEESKNGKSNKLIQDQKTAWTRGRSSDGPCVIDATLTGDEQHNQYVTKIYSNERRFNRVESTHDYEEPRMCSDQEDEGKSQTNSQKEGGHKASWFNWPKRQIDDSGIYDTPNPILRKLTLLRKKPESKDDTGNDHEYEDPRTQDEKIKDRKIYEEMSGHQMYSNEKISTDQQSEDSIASNIFNDKEEKKRYSKNTDSNKVKRGVFRKSTRQIDDANIYDIPSSIFKKLTLRRNKTDRKDATLRSMANKSDLKTSEEQRSEQSADIINNANTKEPCTSDIKAEKIKYSKKSDNPQNVKSGIFKNPKRQIDDENIYDVPSSIFKKLTLRRNKADKKIESTNSSSPDENIYDIPRSLFKKLTLSRKKRADRKSKNITNSVSMGDQESEQSIDMISNVSQNESCRPVTDIHSKEEERRYRSNTHSDDSQTVKKSIFKKTKRQTEEENIYDIPSSIFKKLTLRRNKPDQENKKATLRSVCDMKDAVTNEDQHSSVDIVKTSHEGPCTSDNHGKEEKTSYSKKTDGSNKVKPNILPKPKRKTRPSSVFKKLTLKRKHAEQKEVKNE